MKHSKLIVIGLLTCSALLSGCEKKEIYGCTSPTAKNYSTKATADDGSCVEPINSIYISQEYSASVTPTFVGAEFQEGDFIFWEYSIDPPNQPKKWLSFPYVSSTAVITANVSDKSGRIVTEVFRMDGGTVTFPPDFSFKTRATLIKKNKK